MTPGSTGWHRAARRRAGLGSLFGGNEMALLFIHGVMNRLDKAYKAAKKLRRTMIERELLPTVRKKYPQFSAAEEVFWGDLAMNPLVDLKEFFAKAGEGMGTAEEAEELNEDASIWDAYDLTGSLAGPLPPAEADQEDVWLLQLARTKPGQLVRVLSAPERVEYDEAYAPPPREGAKPAEPDEKAAIEQGEADALWILAVEQAADDLDLQGKLRLAKSGDEVTALIAAAVEAKYRLLTGATAFGPEGAMGTWDDAVAALKKRVVDRCAAVKKGVVQAARAAQRLGGEAAGVAARWGGKQLGPTLLRRLRGKAPNLLPFLGDVFVYLRRGHAPGNPPDETIADRVGKGVRAAAELSRSRNEPFVVISHSFGGPILYDQMASGRLDDVHVDLWITAGSQVGFFAALDVYGKRGLAGRPKVVGTWLNVHNPGDPFSFPAEPVFGADVKDLRLIIRDEPIAAHSAYFAEPAFYKNLGDALMEVTLPGG
jgi:hypothetical protein